MVLIPAASVMVTDSRDRLLMIKRGHEPQRGRWSLPGGKGEPGEDPASTALREAREETGLSLRLLEEVLTTKMPGAAGRVYDIRCFSAEIIGGELQAGDDAEKVRWVSRVQIGELELTTGLSESLRTAGYLPCPDQDSGAARVAFALERTGMPFRLRRYGAASSAWEAADQRGIAESDLIKSLVVRVREGDYLLVLIPADREIDWSQLRKTLGVNRISLASAADAQEVTGFPRGAINPFGTSTALPILLDSSIGDGIVSLGAGTPGWGLTLAAADLREHCDARVAAVSRLTSAGRH